MPHLTDVQGSPRSVPPEALFPLPEEAQWPMVVPGVVTFLPPSLVVSLREPSEAITMWQERGTSTVSISEVEVELLERSYTFRERAEVLGFLERHPFLVPLLLQAYGKIQQHFGPSQVFLEIVTDPEVAGSHQLVAFILTSLEPNDAADRLDRLDEDWWLDALGQAQGNLCITVEFQ